MKKIINSLMIFYSPKFGVTISYMLQASEYSARKYFFWLLKIDDFSKVMVRKQLDKTGRSKMLLILINAGIILELIIGIAILVLGWQHKIVGGVYFGLAIILVYPIVFLIVSPIAIFLAQILISKPQERQHSISAAALFSKTKAKKIAIAGSYGKTSMKELLSSILANDFNVASTKGNMNVASSHASFAKALTGKEDFIIMEFGEGAPGDVKRFTNVFKPSIAVITGLTAAHLDRYKTIQRAGEDIFSVADYVGASHTYVNKDSLEIKKFIASEMLSYSSEGVGSYKVKNIRSKISGICFDLVGDKKQFKIKSNLLGRHQIGPLSIAAVLCLELGMKKEHIESAITKIKPYKHRMEPYQLNGATIIDDTYNGNLEGIKAGTKLLAELEGRRKIYITPGLVDQGKLNNKIHIQVGRLIAECNPDVVVLMKNSVSKFIHQGLNEGGFKKELKVMDDPLEFYTNLSSFVASGDLVMMQNDWPDSYS